MTSEAKDNTLEFIKEVLTAGVYDKEVAIQTPLERADALTELYENKNTIYFKREDLQIGGSFKIRGVYNKFKRLSRSQKRIICASIGNHALAIARVMSDKFGFHIIAVMPKTTSNVIKFTLEKKGIKIILHGDSYEEAVQFAKKYADETGYYYIDESDDHDIIVGSGTIGMEISNQMGSDMKNVHAIFVPVGGGGLISGIARYIKELYPSVKIIGVGIIDSCAMHESMKEGKITSIKKVNSFINISMHATVGEKPFEICKKFVDEIILVSKDHICASVKLLYDETKTIFDPASAICVSGIIEYMTRGKTPITGQKLIAVMSGGTPCFNKLKYISERANIGDGTEKIVKIQIDEKAGSLLKLVSYFETGDEYNAVNITRFHYRNSNSDSDTATIILGLSMYDQYDVADIIARLKLSYKIDEFENTELAEFMPYLIGGLGKKLADEHIFTIILPERSGALVDLLKKTDKMINITLFHYRDIGESHGTILIGLQFTGAKYDDFTKMLDQMKIQYRDVTKMCL